MQLQQEQMNNNEMTEIDLEIEELLKRANQKLDIDRLNKILSDAEKQSEGIIAEMQTNVLIHAGEHYAKISDNFKRTLYRNNRSEKDATNKLVLQLVMNHMESIDNEYINNVLTFAPSTHVIPTDGRDIHQKKNADLNNSVLQMILKQNNKELLVKDFATNFVILGEAVSYKYFTEDGGNIIGYAPKEGTENLTETYYDEMGLPLTRSLDPEPDYTKPETGGRVVIEKLNAFDVLLENGIEEEKDSTVVIVKRLRHKNVMINKIKNSDLSSDEKLKRLKWFIGNNKETFSTVNRGGKSRNENSDLFLVRYFFYKPCEEFPRGKIFETVKDGIVLEYDLQEDDEGKPFFPISFAQCIKIPSMPRGISIIRQGRPLQAEINRTMSKTAEHQILLGDDKIVTTGEQGLTEGAKLGGIRQLSLSKGFQGYQVIPGRSGEQFVPYLQLLIKELYSMYDVENSDTKSNIKANTDILPLIYKNMSQKKKYIIFTQPFEKFLCDISRDVLKLAKRYLSENDLVPYVGKNEYVNIAEFKNSNPLDFDIKIEPISGDAETQMGNFLSFKEIMQFMGRDIPKDVMGKVLMDMPFIPKAKEIFASMNANQERATSIILALDRGETPPVLQYEDQSVILEALGDRMLKGDFIYLVQQNPVIKQNYDNQIQQREQIKKQQLESVMTANMGLIPMTGDLVSVNIWETVPTANGTGTKQTTKKYPIDALKKFDEMISKQQGFVESVSMLPADMQGEISNMPQVNNNNNKGV